MWEVANETRYKADASWGRNKEGVHEWTVVVKATFAISTDGKTTPVEDQLDPLLIAEYTGEPGASSLRYESDLVGQKPTTDILFNGTAYAPGGRPSTEFPIMLKVGPVRKVLRVRGHRFRKMGALGLNATGTEPVVQLPIVYERAYGGYDTTDKDPQRHVIDLRNPVGCGIVGQVGEALPNFEYPDRELAKGGPAGFGAIASHWSPRRELAGTYDEAWRNARLPLLPQDWDVRSRLCSPTDQRGPAMLAGGEQVELVNLTPNGTLRFMLPRLFFKFVTRFGRKSIEHDGRLETVIIEGDHPRVIMVWATSLTCRVDVEYLDETVVVESTAS